MLTRLSGRELVLAAGMPRSGSTLLYNLVRLCMTQVYGDRLLAGWIGDVRKEPLRPVCLMKTHRVGLLRLRARHVFYSYRDIRDALVSARRMFGLEPTLDVCREWIREDLRARKHADVVFRYGELSGCLPKAVERIADVLEADIDTSEVLAQLPQPGKAGGSGYDSQTLLHGGHGTGTRRGAWRTELDAGLLEDIDRDFGWWLDENGFERAQPVIPGNRPSRHPASGGG